jgi:hypothetical protein
MKSPYSAIPTSLKFCRTNRATERHSEESVIPRIAGPGPAMLVHYNEPDGHSIIFIRYIVLKEREEQGGVPAAETRILFFLQKKRTQDLSAYSCICISCVEVGVESFTIRIRIVHKQDRTEIMSKLMASGRIECPLTIAIIGFTTIR